MEQRRLLELVRVDITRPNGERDALRMSRELQELLDRGWYPAYCWISVVSDPQRPGGTEQSLLNLIMLPRPDADLATEEREALAEVLVQAREAPPAVITAINRLRWAVMSTGAVVASVVAILGAVLWIV